MGTTACVVPRESRLLCVGMSFRSTRVNKDMPTMPSPAPMRTSQAPPTRRPTPDADALLMLAVQRDQPGAFDELVDHYWMRVFGRLYRQLGDRQEAEDLTQDVFLRVYRARKRYRPRAKFATWLFHIAQNVARNAVRSRRRHPRHRHDLPACPGQAALSSEP